MYGQVRKGTRLLPFHKEIVKEIADPSNDDLLVMAKGLGLRRVRRSGAEVFTVLGSGAHARLTASQVICNSMKLYDGERNLVILVCCTALAALTIRNSLS